MAEPNKLTLTVKIPGAKTETVETDDKACVTTMDLKKLVVEKSGIPIDQQKLLVKGKVLNDTDILSEKKVKDKSVIFLVKGIADKSSSSTAAAASSTTDTSSKKEAEPEVRTKCKGECGFFGSSDTDNYCSQCWKKKLDKDKEARIKEMDDAEAAEKKKEEDKRKGITNGDSGSDKKVEEEKKEKPVQENKTRCFSCNKKVGLTGIECRCGYVYCAAHRLPEIHNCDFDYKAMQRSILEKQNEKVAADKMGDRL